ncbi:MAG: NifB/NifX family molybdenum-iron cluster-binding protein [Candidatus Omnitrophota bacterium]
MKICITAQGAQLEAGIDPRFGRSQYFIFVDPDTMAWEAVANENASGMGGVGIQSAQLIAEKGAKVVLTGKVGPNASQTLNAAGIQVVLDVNGTVDDAVQSFKNGELRISDGPNAAEKSGLS